ncbi:MAG: hypothetical protein EOP52_11490 [Sphingobacteriales bacterium]|nr:MAG: hypothetical protein EOP52_11490 [Sphingobacteriales bacterium]
MELLFKILLGIHITGGAVSLIAGLVVVLLPKGTRLHRRWGRTFFWSLLVASVVALPICYLHPSVFLALISIFTLYMLLTGVRALQLGRQQKPLVMDWTLTIAIALFGIGFIGLGGRSVSNGDSFGTVLMVFGGIGLLFARQDWTRFKGRATIKNSFLTTHLQRLTGSYIASVTAFLVVNNKVLPGFVAWLLPTVLLTPLIFKWSRKYVVPVRTSVPENG